jgi:hypothetical protein
VHDIEDTSDRELLARAAHWNDAHPRSAWTHAAIREVTVCHGCDFATALLYDARTRSAAHARLSDELRDARNLRSPPVRVAIVPGAFYRESPGTGADGRLIRRAAAAARFPVADVPIRSTGTVAQNAASIAEWLRGNRHEPLILVSVSKGGSDLKTAFARADSAEVFAPVLAWINVCGILNGTPMADWLLSNRFMARANRLFYRMRGRSLSFLEDLRYERLNFPLTVPAGVRVLHLLGYPLRHHLHNGLARRCHTRLSRFGPNDGCIVLADALDWPGDVLPVWGADHYMRAPGDVSGLLEALFRLCAEKVSA